MKLGDYPLEVAQFSCGKCLRNGRYKKSALIEKYTADIPLPDLRTHIAHYDQRINEDLLSPSTEFLGITSLLFMGSKLCGDIDRPDIQNQGQKFWTLDQNEKFQKITM